MSIRIEGFSGIARNLFVTPDGIVCTKCNKPLNLINPDPIELECPCGAALMSGGIHVSYAPVLGKR